MKRLLLIIAVAITTLLLSQVASAQKPVAVDLGLSVKWASFNLGATTPEGYGSYYAWGELVTKNSYSPDNYKWMEKFKLTKYNTDPSAGKVDNKKYLEMEDDAARNKWGGNWRIPTKDECEELVEQCDWFLTKVKGVTGYKVVSRRNGNSIFLPAGDAQMDEIYKPSGSMGCYWSNMISLEEPTYAWCIYFTSMGPSVEKDAGYGRFRGFSIRPVTD